MAVKNNKTTSTNNFVEENKNVHSLSGKELTNDNKTKKSSSRNVLSKKQDELKNAPDTENVVNDTKNNKISSSTNQNNESTKSVKKPSSVKTSKNASTKASEVLQENNNQPINSPTKTKKLRKLKNPILIKVYYKRNKLRKLRKNYGANFSDDKHYAISLSLSTSYSLKKAEEHEIEVKKQGRKKDKKENKKKNLVNFLYFGLNILVIAIVLAIQLSGEPNPQDSITVLFQSGLETWGFLLAALGMYLLLVLSEQIRYAVLMHKACGRYRFHLSYKLVAVGKYYDAITPLSVGGQPFQVFYANKYGVKAGDGISVVTAKYVFQQIIYFFVTSYILFRNLFGHTLIEAGVIEGSIQDGIVSTLSWIGYAATAILIFVIVFMALNKRLGSGFVAGTFKLLSKIKIGKFKIIRDHNKSFISTMKTVNSWQVTTKKYFRSPITIIVNIVFSLVGIFATYTIPFFIYCAFAGWRPEAWFDIVTIAVMVELSSAFNPIPMGIGTADLGFKVLYGALFALAGASTAFVWAYIIWRILVYYINIVQGLGVITYDYIYGNKKLAKFKDYWLLPFKERCKVTKESFLKKNNIK